MRRLLVLAALLVSPAAHAGAWTRDLGSFYAKVGLDLYGARNFTLGGRVAGEGQSYFGRQLNLYGEAGLMPWWRVQLVASLPVVSSGTLFESKVKIPASGPRATTVRVGDLRVGLQAAVHPDLPLAVQVEAKIPMYSNRRVGLDYGRSYQELFPLPGDGQVDLTFWFLGGFAVKDTPLWNDAGVGYRYRSEWFVDWSPDLEFVDGIAFYDTFGATLGRWVPMLRVDGIVNLRSDEVTRQYVALGPVLLVDLVEGLAVEARFSADLWSRNAAQGFGGGIGISIRR